MYDSENQEQLAGAIAAYRGIFSGDPVSDLFSYSLAKTATLET